MSSEAPHDVDDEQDEDGEDEDAGEGLVDDDGGHDRSMPMTAPGPAHIAENVRHEHCNSDPIECNVEALQGEYRELTRANQGLGAALAYCYRKYPELRKEAPAEVRRTHPHLFDGQGVTE